MPLSHRQKNAVYSLVLVVAMAAVYFFRKANNVEEVALKGYTMGSTYSVKYLDKEGRNFSVSIEDILEEFNQSLSTYDSLSEISELHKERELTFRLPYFYPVLNRSKEISEQTNGAFDPTVGPLIRLWNFHKKGAPAALPTRQQIDSLLQITGFKNVTFDEKQVKLIHTNTSLNFNAVAPGYAADVLSEFLEKRDIENYLVEVGGEVRCKGHNIRKKIWSVGIDNPEYESKGGDRLQAIVQVKDRALATSGNYRNFYVVDGRKYAHTIDPRTGRPVEHSLLSTTVLAPDCLTADALATAFMVSGTEKAIEMSKEQNIDVFLVYADGQGNIQTYTSPGLEPFVKTYP